MLILDEDVNQFGCLNCPSPWRQPWPTRNEDLMDAARLLGRREPKIPHPPGAKGIDELFGAYFIGKYGDAKGREVVEKVLGVVESDWFDSRTSLRAKMRRVDEGRTPLLTRLPSTRK